MRSLGFSKEQLVDLYIVQDLVKEEVARRLGCSLQTVNNYCRKYGIKKESSRVAQATKEELCRLYLVENKTQEEIAEFYGCCRRAVGMRLLELGVEKDVSAVVESSRATHLKRYGVAHLLKDKEESARRSKKRVATMLGDDWGPEKVNAQLREQGRLLEMVGGFTKKKEKTHFRCLVDGCGYEWHPHLADVLNGFGCPRCSKRERYTQESFDALMAKRFPHIVRMSPFVNITTRIAVRCNVCGYGADGRWSAKPCNFVAARPRDKCCPRCSRQERWTEEMFVAKLAVVNPNIELVGDFQFLRKPARFRCRIDGYEWTTSARSVIIGKKGCKPNGCPKCAGLVPWPKEAFLEWLAGYDVQISLHGEWDGFTRRTTFLCGRHNQIWTVKPSQLYYSKTKCPLCSAKYVRDGVHYDSSWELLFHYDNPHLKRLYRSDNVFIGYVTDDGVCRRWFPDFLDERTGTLYEVKPGSNPHDKNGMTAAKKKLNAAVWIEDDDILRIQKKHTEFDPLLYRIVK